jgi:hypothetical protein
LCGTANKFGYCVVFIAVYGGHLSCVELLVLHGAAVNTRTGNGWTPLLKAAFNHRIDIAQCLLSGGSTDVHYRIPSSGFNALYYAMCKQGPVRTPGIVFAFLCCNTDAKNVHTDRSDVTIAMRDAHIETYKHVQGYIDEYSRILIPVLSEHVPADLRVGLGDNGIYQEPLERVLEYLGLSMSKDQVVNASIDGGGEGVKRALVPGHLLNANRWFDKYQDRQ